MQARLEDDAQCLLVIIGATAEGKKELVGLADGIRESAQSWKELLLDLKRRGLTIDPQLAVADGALGFWKAIDEVWPKTRAQRCWVHKTANVLNKLPKSLQAKAKRALQDIWMAETRKAALRSIRSSKPTASSTTRPPSAWRKTARRCSPSTTSPPSTGNICARQTRSRARSRPSGIERSDRRVASRTRPPSP